MEADAMGGEATTTTTPLGRWVTGDVTFSLPSWKDFFAIETVEKPPTLDAAKARALVNVEKYWRNYTCIAAGFVCLSILSDGVATLITAAGLFGAYAVTTNFKNVKQRFDVTKPKLVGAAVGYAIVIAAFTSALQLVCVGLVAAFLFCGFHAVLHDRPTDFS